MRRAARVVPVVVAVALVAGLGGVAAVRVRAEAPAPQLTLGVPATLDTNSSAPPPITMPAQGSLELEADPGGVLAGRDAGSVRQIGSVAKTMTALVVLEAHPLTPGADGPVLTMTDADAALYRQGLAAGGSVVPVAAGEQLTERDVLLALMLPSANNLAETLARWVSGSREAFIARLNATAQRLGMTRTHFDDPSGFSDQTVSTAADLVRLGFAALADPGLADIVHTSSATLPDGTALTNLDALLTSVPGWLGIKTGETNAAGGCLLFADRGVPDPDHTAATVTVVGAVLGQPHLAEALSAARGAVSSALGGYRVLDPVHDMPPARGSLSADWGDVAGLRVVAAGGDAAVPAVPVRDGVPVALTAMRSVPAAPLTDGQTVAVIEARAGRQLVGRWDVVADGEIRAPSGWWRLLHG